jgi:hypothetical protein
LAADHLLPALVQILEILAKTLCVIMAAFRAETGDALIETEFAENASLAVAK